MDSLPVSPLVIAVVGAVVALLTVAFAESHFDAVVVDRDGHRHPVPAAPSRSAVGDTGRTVQA